MNPQEIDGERQAPISESEWEQAQNIDKVLRRGLQKAKRYLKRSPPGVTIALQAIEAALMFHPMHADERLTAALKGGQGVPIRITSESIESSAEISQLEQDRDEWKARAEKAEAKVDIEQEFLSDEPGAKNRLRRAGEGEDVQS